MSEIVDIAARRSKSRTLCESPGVVQAEPLGDRTVRNKTHLAILATPPETSGERTLKRLMLAQELLGFQRLIVANVLDVATYRTNGMTSAGLEPEPWLQSRRQIRGGLTECDGVLLGYGVSEPSGPARGYYRNQIDWLWGELRERSSPIWSVEMPPRHPSRWHRLTFRLAPGVPFAEALSEVLTRVDSASALGSS